MEAKVLLHAPVTRQQALNKSLQGRCVSMDIFFFFFIPHLFAICTGTISKWRSNDEGTRGRGLSSTLP
jgi:hypothetical protein